MADWYRASVVKESTVSSSSETALDDDDVLAFTSRRSSVVCRHAMVATSQPLASSIGYDILKQGGNAADAAVAIAAALAVTEPCSTGLGGDMFCLYYDAQTRQVSCINGSGRSPAALTLARIQQKYPSSPSSTSSSYGFENTGVNVDAFRDSPLAVTVPGAAAGWEDLWRRHGSGRPAAVDMGAGTTEGLSALASRESQQRPSSCFAFESLLEPAARLAEEGFPVAPITSYHWRAGHSQITKWLPPSSQDDTIPLTCRSGQPPQPGEIVVNKDLARVLRNLGREGAVQGFYQGATGKAIADVVQQHGGCLAFEDLVNHTSDFPIPISTVYRGCRMWQAPPNGQGLACLVALQGLQHLTEAQILPDPIIPGSATAYHAMIEMMRLGFSDLRSHVSDEAHMKLQCAHLLDPNRIGPRAVQSFDPYHATIHGSPDASSCTVSFQVVDTQGNAVSMVNSNFQGFGTGIVPHGCGFTLQNRGFGFHLVQPDQHPNAVGPNKRPCHTIIPGMLTHDDTGELYATLSNMGGNMQPQGHLQLTVDLLAGNVDPQAAIDMPRFCIPDGTQQGIVYLEDGIDPAVVADLERRGHKLKVNIRGHERSIFGRAQIIKRDRATGVLWGGSDGRADGCAMGF